MHPELLQVETCADLAQCVNNTLAHRQLALVYSKQEESSYR